MPPNPQLQNASTLGSNKSNKVRFLLLLNTHALLAYPRSSSNFAYLTRMSRPYQPLPPPAEVSPEIVLATVAFGIVLIYSLISAPAGLPAIWELLLIYLPGKLFGPAVRERLELMFGVGLGPGNTLRRVRNTASSVLGVNGNGKGGSYVCGLWNLGNTCYQNSVLQASIVDLWDCLWVANVL
jgi:hypothetical protein